MRKARMHHVFLVALLSLGLVTGVADADIESGPIAYYPCEEAEGDIVHNAVEGTIGEDGQAQGGYERVEGKVGDFAILFDGQFGSFVDCGTWNPSEGTGQLTAAAWINWGGLTGQYQGVVSKRDGWTETDTCWHVELNVDTGNIGFGRWESYPDFGDENIPPIGEWQHLAVTFDGTTCEMYIDGVSVGTSTVFSFGPKTDANVVFGAVEGSGSNPFNGAIDEVRIYDQALTADDILELYNWTGVIIDAGEDQRLECDTAVTLNGRGPDDTTSFTWEQIIEGDEPSVTLSDPNSDTTTFTSPCREIGYILTFRLTVVSPSEGTLSDEVLVHITAPNEPRIPPGNFRTYPSNLGYRMEWDALVDADDYGFGIKLGPGMYFWFWTFDTYYDLTNLTEGATTIVAVKGRNNYGEGVVSDDITLIPMRNLALPEGFPGTIPPSDYVTISGQPVSGMNDTIIEDDNNDSNDGLYKEEDYWGYLWDEPLYFDHIAYFTGNMFGDGGWFLDLRVQYTQDGATWIGVPTRIEPQYDFTDERTGRQTYERYDLHIPTLRGTGIRIYGTPGGTATFTSISELEVYGDNATARDLVVQGLDAEVPENSTATLDGSLTFSTRGDITSAIWEQLSGPAVTIDLTADPLVATFEAPGVDEDTLLVFKLTAGDGTETLSDDDVRITVRNLMTTAVAGPDQRVLEGDEVTLDGSGPLTTTGNLTYQWTQTSGDPVTLNTPNAAVCTFAAPATIWAYKEELTFQLEVNDGAGGVSTDDVVIKVRNSLTASVFDMEPIDEPAGWQFQGSANYDEGAGILEITPAAIWMTGSAFLTETIDCTQFRARFKLYIGDGDGADGMVFGWVKGPSFMGGGGGALGWYGGGLRGYGIVFDTYPNPAMNLVSFEDPEVHTAENTGGFVSYTPPIDMENAGWFDVEIEMDNGHLQVWMTNEAQGLARTLAIEYTLDDYTGFDAYFGFTGATGGSNNNHWVDDPPMVLSDAYAVRELPTSYEAGGTVDVGLSMRVNPDNKPSTVTVSEPIPAGLTVVDAGGGSVVGGSLNWSFSGGDVGTQAISYTLGVPGDYTGAVSFTGTISFAGTTDALKGDNIIYENPVAPQNLDAEMLLGAELSWSANTQEGIVGYRIFRSVNGQEWEELGVVSGTSYLDKWIEPGSTYNYKVRAVNAVGAEGPFSDPTGEKMITMEIIEAEDFNYGGGLYPGYENCPAAVEATAEDDLAAGNDYWHPSTEGPNEYRPNDVTPDGLGIETIAEADNPTLDHTNIGWIDAGSWYRYTLEVPEPGPGDPEGGWIKLVFRLAGPRAQAAVAAYWDETLVGIARMPGTGDWHLFEYAILEEQFQTTPGVHTLRVQAVDTDPAEQNDINFDKIGIGFNWSPPTREPIFEDDFEDYTTLYSYADLVAAGYTVENASNEDGAWRLWNTAGNMLGNVDPDIESMTDNYMISDSDLAGAVDVDEELITPEIDCTNHTKVRLNFNKNYRVYADDTAHDQVAEVDVREVGGDWVNLLRFDTTTVDLNNDPADDTAAEVVDLSAYDGKVIQIRFHFYEANYDYWFAIDDVVVSGDKEPEKPPEGHITGLVLDQGKVVLTWESFADNYTVEYTDDLAGANWQPVPGTWPTTETAWSGEDISGMGARFYRVVGE